MKNKAVLLIVLSFFSIKQIYAQIPSWVWAKGTGESNYMYTGSVCNDANGNTYATGCFVSDSIVFGVDTLWNDTTNGSADIYVVKYSPSGNVLWAKSVGGSGGDFGYSVTCDVSGNVYVAGYFTSPEIVFGSDTLTVPHSPVGGMFIMKFDVNGNKLWAKSDGDFSAISAQRVVTDKHNNVYVTGYFTATKVTFGTLTINLPLGEEFEIFVVKFDSIGNPLWLTGAASKGGAYPFGISTDGIGNIYVTGDFSDTMHFGSNELIGSNNQIFLAKYNSNGSVVWAKQSTGSADANGGGITTDKDGNSFVSGDFDLDSITIGSFNLPLYGSESVFVARYDSSGNALWAKSYGGSGISFAEGCSLASDDSDNAYAIGTFGNGLITIGSYTLFETGGTGYMFIAKFDSAGNTKWALSVGNGPTLGNDISLDKARNIYSIGNYSSAPVFGNDTLPNKTGDDIFIAKLGNNLLTSTSCLPTCNSFIVFPNPSSGVFQLSINNPDSYRDQLSIKTVEVYNVLGEKVETGHALSLQTTFSIDLHSQPNGVYFYRVLGEDGGIEGEGKLVIEK